jgi:transposase-like protein
VHPGYPDFPVEHCAHLKTTNPIESTFATVRLRTKVTKGRGSRAAGLAMAFNLIEAAQDRWRSVNTFSSSPWCVLERCSRAAS